MNDNLFTCTTCNRQFRTKEAVESHSSIVGFCNRYKNSGYPKFSDEKEENNAYLSEFNEIIDKLRITKLHIQEIDNSDLTILKITVPKVDIKDKTKHDILVALLNGSLKYCPLCKDIVKNFDDDHLMGHFAAGYKTAIFEISDVFEDMLRNKDMINMTIMKHLCKVSEMRKRGELKIKDENGNFI